MAAIRRHSIELISLFAGAGGLDLAFERSGATRTIARVEIQPEYCATLRRAEELGHLTPAPLFEEDIRTVSIEDVIGRARRSKVTRGVIGGPPCETFSSMGKRQGVTDPRGGLVMGFAEFVMKSNPDFFLLENVPQLAKSAGGSTFLELIGHFADGGYLTSHKVLNAADYGAATTRRRLFIVGVRTHHVFRFPSPTHDVHGAEGLHRWVTVGDALSGLPRPADALPGKPTGHVRIKHQPQVVARFMNVLPGSYDYVRKRSRLSLDSPSVSLVAGDLRGARAHIHPLEPRELTKRECARIQGFPDDFEFAGSQPAVAKQIANAVPIPLGTAMARAIRTHFEGKS